MKQTTILNQIDYWRGTRDSARFAGMAGATKTLGSLVRSSRTQSMQTVRIGFTFTFRDTRQRTTRTGGNTIDIPAELTMKDVRTIIKRSIEAWYNEHYEARSGGRKPGSPPVSNIDIKWIEGL